MKDELQDICKLFPGKAKHSGATVKAVAECYPRPVIGWGF